MIKRAYGYDVNIQDLNIGDLVKYYGDYSAEDDLGLVIEIEIYETIRFKWTRDPFEPMEWAVAQECFDTGHLEVISES